MRIEVTTPAATDVAIECADGFVLAGKWWKATGGQRHGTVVVNAATGVPARYYGRYAAFLARHGFDVLTYDYRGIGRSAPADLRTLRCRWQEWGTLDFDAALALAAGRKRSCPLMVVGHSYGGFLPGLSRNASAIDRMLTIGAQFGYWPDYALGQRARLYLKWHVVMPALTLACGYFPGRRLGWIEDLPRGVAFGWAFHPSTAVEALPYGLQGEIRGRLAAVTAPTLAIAIADDPLGTPRAIRRALAPYLASERTLVRLSPADLGVTSVGHFGAFHDRHAAGLWIDTLAWLCDGVNPWPDRTFPLAEPTADRHPHFSRYY